jgi:hypothetical protein
MNATLTWWGVAVAISGHDSQGSAIIGRETLTQIVPVFVAIMVWVIRILIIGTFSVAGESMFAPEPVSFQPVTARPGHRSLARPVADHTLEAAQE